MKILHKNLLVAFMIGSSFCIQMDAMEEDLYQSFCALCEGELDNQQELFNELFITASRDQNYKDMEQLLHDNVCVNKPFSTTMASALDNASKSTGDTLLLYYTLKRNLFGFINKQDLTIDERFDRAEEILVFLMKTAYDVLASYVYVDNKSTDVQNAAFRVYYSKILREYYCSGSSERLFNLSYSKMVKRAFESFKRLLLRDAKDSYARYAWVTHCKESTLSWRPTFYEIDSDVLDLIQDKVDDEEIGRQHIILHIEKSFKEVSDWNHLFTSENLLRTGTWPHLKSTIDRDLIGQVSRVTLGVTRTEYELILDDAYERGRREVRDLYDIAPEDFENFLKKREEDAYYQGMTDCRSEMMKVYPGITQIEELNSFFEGMKISESVEFSLEEVQKGYMVGYKVGYELGKKSSKYTEPDFKDGSEDFCLGWNKGYDRGYQDGRDNKEYNNEFDSDVLEVFDISNE